MTSIFGTWSRFQAPDTTSVIFTHGCHRRPMSGLLRGPVGSPQPIFDKSVGFLNTYPASLSRPFGRGIRRRPATGSWRHHGGPEGPPSCRRGGGDGPARARPGRGGGRHGRCMCMRSDLKNPLKTSKKCPKLKTIWNHFSICACHPCAGAMLIFSVSFQVYQMSPKTQRGEGVNSINSPQESTTKNDGGVGLEDGTTPRHRSHTHAWEGRSMGFGTGKGRERPLGGI